MDTRDHAIYRVWIHCSPTSLYLRREEKPFGLSWNQTCFTSDCSNPLDHGSSGIYQIKDFFQRVGSFIASSYNPSQGKNECFPLSANALSYLFAKTCQAALRCFLNVSLLDYKTPTQPRQRHRTTVNTDSLTESLS